MFLVEEGASPLAVDTALNSGKGRAAAAKEAATAAASGGALLNEEGGLGGGPAAAVASALPFGMAMGPLEMADLAGGDIGHNVRRERGLLNPATRPVVTIPARLASSFTTTTTTATQGVLPSSPSSSSSSSGGGVGGANEAARPLVVPMRYCELGDALVDAGRVGHKTGKGWYNYTAPPSPAAAAGGAAAAGRFRALSFLRAAEERCDNRHHQRIAREEAVVEWRRKRHVDHCAARQTDPRPLDLRCALAEEGRKAVGPQARRWRIAVERFGRPQARQERRVGIAIKQHAQSSARLKQRVTAIAVV